MDQGQLHKIIMIVLIVYSVVGIPVVTAQRSEYEVKAAFIEKFTHFIEWPSDTSTDGHFVIYVFPDSPMLPYLKRIFQNHFIKGKPVDLLISDNLMLLDSAHIVIVNKNNRYLMPVIYSIIKTKPILTIGDYPGFLEAGGILLLYREEDNIHFTINISALGKTNLTVSSQLLKLAKIYQGQR